MSPRFAPLLLVTTLAACTAARTPRHETPPAAPRAPAPATTPDVVATPAEPPTPAAPTERPRQGAGSWRIAATSVRTPEETAAYVKKLQGAGYRVEIEAAFVAGASWQRVVLPGYARAADARTALPAVNALLGDGTAWVLPRAQPATVAPKSAAPAPQAPPAPVPPPTPDAAPAN